MLSSGRASIASFLRGYQTSVVTASLAHANKARADSSSNTATRRSSPPPQGAILHYPPRNSSATRTTGTTHTTHRPPSWRTCSSGARRSRCPILQWTRASGGKTCLCFRGRCRGVRRSRRGRSGTARGTSGHAYWNEAYRGHRIRLDIVQYIPCTRMPWIAAWLRQLSAEHKSGVHVSEHAWLTRDLRNIVSLTQCIGAVFSNFQIYLSYTTCESTDSNEQARRPGSYH